MAAVTTKVTDFTAAALTVLDPFQQNIRYSLPTCIDQSALGDIETTIGEGMDALDDGDLTGAADKLADYMKQLMTASTNCLADGGPADVKANFKALEQQMEDFDDCTDDDAATLLANYNNGQPTTGAWSTNMVTAWRLNTGYTSGQYLGQIGTVLLQCPPTGF